MKHLFRLISLLVFAALLTATASGAQGESIDPVARVMQLEAQLPALRLLRQYNLELEQAVARGDVLLVDDKMGYRVAVPELRLREIVSALQELDRAGIAPPRAGFFRVPVGGDVNSAMQALRGASQRAFEQSVKPASAGLNKMISDGEKELAALKAKLGREPAAGGDRWIMQPTKLNPDKISPKITDASRRGHVYEHISSMSKNSFTYTDRHIFQGKPGTHDYTCSFTFTDPPQEIRLGSEFTISFEGECRANAGLKIGKVALELEAKGRDFRMVPAGSRPVFEVGERLQAKVPSDKYTFRYEVLPIAPRRGAIMQLNLKAQGWGRVLTWSWKYGEGSPEPG